MGIDASNIWQLTDALSGKPEAKANTRLATVSRIDDEGHVWVSIPGGETETPTETTDVEVERGDTVTVEWRNNKLYVLGNSTQPATSTKRVVQIVEPIEETANEAAAGVGKAVDASKAAQQAAAEAEAVAEAVNQHFWFRSTDPGDGAGTGAFVTDKPQDDFLDDIEQGVQPTTQNPLHNLMMNSQGILLRSALKWFASFTQSTVTFFDGIGNGVNNIVAQFGANLARIGKANGNHVDITSSGMDVLNGNTSLAQFGSGGARIGTSPNCLTMDSSSVAYYNGNASSKSNAAWLVDSNGFRIGALTTLSGSSETEYILISQGEISFCRPWSTTISRVFHTTGSGTGGLNEGLQVATRAFMVTDEDKSETYLTLDEFHLETAYFSVGDGTIRINAEPYVYLMSKYGNTEKAFCTVIAGNNYENGMSVRLGAGGLTIIGSGEADYNLYRELLHPSSPGGTAIYDDTEQLHLAADSVAYIHSNCNTIANRKTWQFNTDGSLTLPNGNKLGTFAEKNSLGITTTSVSGTGKNTSQVAANGTTTIEVTIKAPANSVLEGLAQLSCSTWSLVLCGWQCSNSNTVAGSVKVSTYWRNVTSSAVAANGATVTVVGKFIQKQNIS